VPVVDYWSPHSPALAGYVSRYCRETDGGIIAQGCDRFQGHAATALNGPFVISFEEDCADHTLTVFSFDRLPFCLAADAVRNTG
jgi:hypothetical protein